MSWLLILKRKQKISSNAFRIGTFLFRSCSFGIETINTFIRSRSSFENHTRFHTPGQSLYPFSDPNGANPTLWGGTYQHGLHTGVPNTRHWCDIDFLIHISFINYLLLQVLLYKKFLTSFGLHFYRFLQEPCEIRYFIFLTNFIWVFFNGLLNR